jgi:hypothetical protein
MEQKCSYIGCKRVVIGYFTGKTYGLWLCERHKMGKLQTSIKKAGFGHEIKKAINGLGSATERVLNNPKLKKLDDDLKRIAG